MAISPTDWFSHIKWFINGAAPNVEPVSATEYAAVLALTVLGLLALHRLETAKPYLKFTKQTDRQLKSFAEYVPTIVRLSVGLMIILNIAQGYVLAPNIANAGTTANIAAISLLSLSAFLLVSGLFVRSAALIMILGYLASFLTPQFLDSFDHLEYLAAGSYLFLRGGGAFSVKIEGMKNELRLFSRYKHLALPLLKIFTGTALAVLAFSEKLLNLDGATAFLQVHDWNVLAALGISDRHFILMAGTVELIIGLSLMLDLAVRFTTLILLTAMVCTALALGVDEIIGHLFAVGVVAAVWIPDLQGQKQ